jgi:O-Antigen ligase
VTTALQRTGQDGPAGRLGRDAAAGGEAKRRQSWFARDPAWPIVAALAGWPVWWALGIENQIFILFAIPMARRLYLSRARRGRRIRFPRGFGIWALFMIVAVAGVAGLALTAPETIASSVANRYFSWTYRAFDYTAAMILLLYAGNLTERELPRQRLAWLLGLVGIYAVAGGFLGIADPHLSFTSPIAHLLPAKIQAGLSASLNPGTAENMAGGLAGRVKAPFTFTNQWGNAIAITLPWLLVAWRSYGTRRQGRLAVAIAGLAVVPIVLSQDRGLWIGLIAGMVYFAVRLALHGKVALLAGLCGALALAAVVILASPLSSLISQRLQNGKSNSIRGSLTQIAIRDAESSPIIGYGDSRHMIGSPQSIAIGSNANCHNCGNTSVGSNGQLQMLLITTGFVGAGLYIGFFAYSAWRYRRDTTPYGMVGELVLLLGFVFMTVYEAAGPVLAFNMLAVALMWKNDTELRNGNPALADNERHALQPGTAEGAVAGGLPA